MIYQLRSTETPLGIERNSHYLRISAVSQISCVNLRQNVAELCAQRDWKGVSHWNLILMSPNSIDCYVNGNKHKRHVTAKH